MEIREVQLNADNALATLKQLCSSDEFVLVILPDVGCLMVRRVQIEMATLFSDEAFSDALKASLDDVKAGRVSPVKRKEIGEAARHADASPQETPEQKLQRELTRLLEEKDEAIRNADYERASELRDQAKKVQDELDQLKHHQG